MRSEIRALTGLRGIAASLVVFYHYFPGTSIPRLAFNFLRHGYLCVDLFFILSGFVMALNYGPMFERDPSLKTYWGFLNRRLGRVYPLYLVITIATFILTITKIIPSVAGPLWLTIISNLCLVQAWGIAVSIDHPGWSISTEFAAYLIFPILVPALLKAPVIQTLIGMILAFSSLAFITTRSSLQLASAYRNGPLDAFAAGTPYPLLRCLAGFILGLVAFRLVQNLKFRSLMRNRLVVNGIALTLIVVMVIPQSDLLIVLLFAGLIAALASSEESLIATLIGSKAIYSLGLISYSIYLVHYPLNAALRIPLKTMLQGLQVPSPLSVSGCILLIPCVVIAAITYNFVEKPARNWSRRIAGLSRRSILAEPSAS